MKKLLLTLIVSLAMCGSIFAQYQYESHWPDFYYPAFQFQTPCVAAIEIDGQIVTADYPNWDALEIAFFVGDECRGAGVAFSDYNPAVNYLTNDYVEEYGDPFPIIDGAPVYYDNAGETVTIKMFDHVNGIEYNECTVTLEGAPYEILTGGDNIQGYWDPENPIILHFTTSAAPVCGIVLNANNEWTMDFEYATNTELLPLEQHDACWTWTRLVELPADYQDTLPHLYYKADDDAHAQFAHGNYSLRLWNRGIYAMPALDEDININDLKMSFYSRHSYSFYTLMVGVMDDPTDEETFVPVAYVDNGTSLNMEYFECNFANYEGEGRYIAFKNVRPSATSYDAFWADVHSVNYIDDITISLMEIGDCFMEPDMEQDFEDVTDVTTKLTGAMPECWELVEHAEDMTFDKMPQVYCQASLANSGNYSFRMVNFGVVALPELMDYDMNRVRVSMFVRQPNENYQLQVGVWEPAPGADGGIFVPVALVNNASTGYERVECDFSNYTGEGTRIAFRNTLASGVNFNYSYNYIDDIAISYNDDECYAMVDEEYFEDFDLVTTSTQPATGVAPSCWEVVLEDVDMAYDKYPQVYYNENFANSGPYSLRLADRCVYAMPELNDVYLPDYTLHFTLRQPNPLYQLEVGVWEINWDNNQEPVEEFVPVATFHNSSDEVIEVSCDFAEYEGYGNRIAFRNTLSNGRTDLNYSYNYIDDVQLVQTEQAKNNNSAESVIDEMGLDRYLESISVYPNPTVGEIHIGAVDVQKVECYNQMGQLVAVYDNESNISLNSLANGVYTLRITVPQGVTMRKVVKE